MRYFVIAYLLTSVKLVAHPLTVEVSQQNGAPLPSAVVEVYVGKLESRNTEQRQNIMISQTGRKFMPYISVVEVGRTVEFINQDNISHHIYSLIGPEQFSFTLKPGHKKVKKVFSSAGIAAMGCNIHDWMSGYLKIVSTPFYGKTDNQGRLSIQLPLDARIKTVTVWHPQMTHILSTDNPKERDLHFTLVSELKPIPTQEPPKQIRYKQRYR